MAEADLIAQPTLRVAVAKPKFGIYYALLIIALCAMLVVVRRALQVRQRFWRLRRSERQNFRRRATTAFTRSRHPVRERLARDPYRAAPPDRL